MPNHIISSSRWQQVAAAVQPISVSVTELKELVHVCGCILSCCHPHGSMSAHAFESAPRYVRSLHHAALCMLTSTKSLFEAAAVVCTPQMHAAPHAWQVWPCMLCRPPPQASHHAMQALMQRNTITPISSPCPCAMDNSLAACGRLLFPPGVYTRRHQPACAGPACQRHPLSTLSHATPSIPDCIVHTPCTADGVWRQPL